MLRSRVGQGAAENQQERGARKRPFAFLTPMSYDTACLAQVKIVSYEIGSVSYEIGRLGKTYVIRHENK